MLLLFSAIDVQAQNRVTGKVTDDNGEGLPGVNVLVEGTSTGVITDTAGDYRIAVPDGSHVYSCLVLWDLLQRKWKLGTSPLLM
ncbi:MAG: carboxypeptidase-like regulatory domain-containing protein [Cytophagales bacterium]|nr:carboxypeptidase-like regulatory domain-containing protein [Cytophagales bacterium]